MSERQKFLRDVPVKTKIEGRLGEVGKRVKEELLSANEAFIRGEGGRRKGRREQAYICTKFAGSVV